MSANDAYTDVVELCALLQCLGFSVKSLDSYDDNASQDTGVKTVVIKCQSSGLHVVLESAGLCCSCPSTNLQNSGIWQVSGVAGGKQLDKEFGCTLLGSLPKTHRDRLTAELREMILCIKQYSETDIDKPKDKEMNKSASMVDLTTPEKRIYDIKIDTPIRYRSLDTLTGAKEVRESPLPEPGPLQRQVTSNYVDEDKNEIKTRMCRRQSTYTVSSSSGSIRRRNKTSSPIQSQNTLLDNLIAAEKAAEELRNNLAFVIKEFVEDGKNDSSMSSLVLDVSKISVLKGETSKAQFASSPNLSGMGTIQENFAKSRLKRFESNSTNNLAPSKATPNKEEKMSKLRRLSPRLFGLSKDSTPNTKVGSKGSETKSSKLNSLLKAKIATPIHGSRGNLESSPCLRSSKKKFSHVKSTIPKPTKKE